MVTTTTVAETSDPAAAPTPHVLLVPYPARGHMQPLLHLASRLAAAGLRLTVVATTSTLHLLSPLLAEHPSSVSPLTFPSFENDTSGPTSVGVDIHALAALREPLGEWVRARYGGDGRVVAVLSDFFCGWTQPLAAEAGVPRLVFAPSGVLATAATHSLFRRMPRPPPPTADAAAAGREYAVEFPGLPGTPAFPWRQLSRMYRSYVEGHGGVHGEAIKNNFLWNLESSAFVCNTSRALEGRYLDAQPLEDLAGKRVWAVGPVAPELTTVEPSGEVTRWLDAFPDASVAYVSFGSMMALPPPHAASLAAALEKSNTPFVWAASTATLPEGFEERTAASETGMVIRGWAPQTAVLRHPAVGCFVTHCGWNSVVEAAAAGVPMLAWPMAADQFFNARLVVDEARVGAPVSFGGFGHVPDADELAGVLGEVIGEAGSEMRARAKELAARMAEAARGDGSSRRDLDGMVRELWDLGSRS